MAVALKAGQSLSSSRSSSRQEPEPIEGKALLISLQRVTGPGLNANPHATENSGSENPLHSEPSSPASPDNKTAASKLQQELAAAEAVASAPGGVRETVEVDLDDIYGK